MAKEAHLETKRRQFEPCHESVVLGAMLGELAPGDELTWDEVNERLGFDVREKRYVVKTARDIALRDHGKVIGSVFGEGLRCLTDEEKLKKPAAARKRIRQIVKKEKKHLATVEVAKLDASERQTFNLQAAHLSMVEMVAGENSFAKLVDNSDASKPISPQKLLRDLTK